MPRYFLVHRCAGCSLWADRFGSYVLEFPDGREVHLQGDDVLRLESELLIGDDGFVACSRRVFLLVFGSYENVARYPIEPATIPDTCHDGIFA